MTHAPRSPGPAAALLADRVPAELGLQRFRDLTDRAADFIAIVAADGTGSYVNPQAASSRVGEAGPALPGQVP